jgi:DNA-directed RNA polymerase specialized sigma24 family protein
MVGGDVDPYQGFDEFVTINTAALSRVAFLLTGDHHRAEDLLQVALSQVAAHWPEVRNGNPSRRSMAHHQPVRH